MSTQPDVDVTPAALPRRRLALLASAAVVVLVVDVVSKIVAVALLEGREPVSLLGGALYLPLIRNGGAAFGLAEGWTAVLALISLGVVGFIVWIARKLRSGPWALGLGMVLGGALGNLGDRIFRAPGPLRGHVVDFLSLFDPYGRVWPVFNVADSAICVGGVLIVTMALLQRDYDGTRAVKKDKG
ncbi:signal peptidase II [Umezawaea sp.]|uniref:signal peptidase II n=1 Tax=Umezawaea sp. TaxID=1955258 RepID=UPI002ED5D7E3